MEIPDVIVVNKADHPLTDTMVREIKGVLALGPHEGWQVPIVKTEAVRGEGVAGARSRSSPSTAPTSRPRARCRQRRRRNLMNEVLGDRDVPDAPGARGAVREDPDVQELLDRVVARELDPASAAAEILERRSAELVNRDR